MKILLVENHAVFAATVVDQFLCSDDVRVVSSAVDGLAAVGAAPFDVLLVDYDLDDGKGDQFVRGVRASGFSTPIVAVSARDEGNQAMIDAGADAICHKRGFARIEEVIQRAQQAQRQTVCRVCLTPPRAGWIRMLVMSGSDRLEVAASYTPRDSVGELVSALQGVLRSDASAVVAFNSEPEVTMLQLQPDGDDIELALKRYPDHRIHEDRATSMFQRRIPRRQAVLAFLRPLRALRRACPPDIYEHEWRHAFPERAVAHLEELLERCP